MKRKVFILMSSQFASMILIAIASGVTIALNPDRLLAIALIYLGFGLVSTAVHLHLIRQAINGK